ncbi:MAG: S-layer homology domain-containing protein, partial [Oscillospiraceae bacterium]
MTTKSRFIAIMLISIMLLQSICVVSFAADDEATTEAKPETKTEEKAEEKPKEDIKYNFNQTALNLMMDLGVYDSTKDEDNAVKVTKAEFAELICKLTNVHDRVKDDKTSTFYMKDVLESHWANSFIQWVLGNGIMTLDDGNFEPERLVDTQTVITATINLLGRNFAVK